MCGGPECVEKSLPVSIPFCLGFTGKMPQTGSSPNEFTNGHLGCVAAFIAQSKMYLTNPDFREK